MDRTVASFSMSNVAAAGDRPSYFIVRVWPTAIDRTAAVYFDPILDLALSARRPTEALLPFRLGYSRLHHRGGFLKVIAFCAKPPPGS